MEQQFFGRRCRGARAVVVECMAIAAENQRVMSQRGAPTRVLTNAFVDHLDEIGDTGHTAQTLALSVPQGAGLCEQ